MYKTRGPGYSEVCAPGFHAVLQLDGHYRDRSDKEEAVVSPGDLALFRQGRSYTTGGDHDVPTRSLVFSITPSDAMCPGLVEISALLSDADGPPHVELPARLAVRARLALIALDADNSAVELQEVLAAVNRHVSRIASHGRQAASASDTAAAHRELVQRLIETIGLSPGEAWSLEGLAERVHSSPYHLARIVRSQTGHSISDLISRARVLHASKLIEKTDWSLDLIARHCGYTHRGRLGKLFKAACGHTMAAYRSEVRDRQRRARATVL